MIASHSAGKFFHTGSAWYSFSCSSHQCMSCSCRRRPSSAPTRISRSWYGSSKRRPCLSSVGNKYQLLRGKGLVARPCSFHQARRSEEHTSELQSLRHLV